MKKLLITLVLAIGIFGIVFWTSFVMAKSCFDPIDEPTTPFERVEYYVKDVKDRVLIGTGSAGMEYGIGIDPRGVVMVAENYGYLLVIIAKVPTTTGDIYVQSIKSFIITTENQITKESAETLADEILTSGEDSGVWFRNGYVLYWQRDIDSKGL